MMHICRNNKKGFSLIELLAVIVILAVVMLIAVTAVGPMMAKARKSALGTEGLALIKAAQSAYQSEIGKGTSAAFTSTSSVCFSLDYLNNKGYYKKGDSDGYNGSIAVKYNSSTGDYTYKYWITNGTYMYIANSDSAVNPDKAKDYIDTYSSKINQCQPTSYTNRSSESGPQFAPASTESYDFLCTEDSCKSPD